MPNLGDESRRIAYHIVTPSLHTLANFSSPPPIKVSIVPPLNRVDILSSLFSPSPRISADPSFPRSHFPSFPFSALSWSAVSAGTPPTPPSRVGSYRARRFLFLGSRARERGALSVRGMKEQVERSTTWEWRFPLEGSCHDRPVATTIVEGDTRLRH